MADFLGQQLGNYRLIRLIGHGGFADVYLGEHVRLGMQAAIKVLHAHLAAAEIFAFEREAQVIAELEHPHIIRVLDFDTQYGRPFLVLSYAPNGSLGRKHVRGIRLALPVVASYIEQIASALQYAHDRKVIHRDVKPENMLIGKQGEVLLSDFGIAGIVHSTFSMNGQQPMGTLEYIAPEQVQGQSRPSSDQYALAVSVYQWLSGGVPFQGSSSEIIAQHLGSTVPPLRTRVPGIPVEIDRVVLKALAKNPRERYESVQGFASAFEQAMAYKKGDTAERLSLLPSHLPIREESSAPSNSGRFPNLAPAPSEVAQKSMLTPSFSSSYSHHTDPLTREKVRAYEQKQSDALVAQKKPWSRLSKAMRGVIVVSLLVLLGSLVALGIGGWNYLRVQNFVSDYQKIVGSQPTLYFTLTSDDQPSKDAWAGQNNSDCSLTDQGFNVKNGAPCVGNNGLIDQRVTYLLVQVTMNITGTPDACGGMAVSVGFQEIDLCANGVMQNCTAAAATCESIPTSAIVRGTNKENTLAIEVTEVSAQQISLTIFVNGQYIADRTVDAHKDLAKPLIYLKSPGSGNNVLFTNLKIWTIDRP